MNRFQFILLLVDDIEEAIRYSRGGKERGIASDYCDVKWKVDETRSTIEMDYTNYNSEAHSKFKQMQTKYKAQISRKGAGLNYEIVMKFRDKQTDDDLNLFLTKDKK